MTTLRTSALTRQERFNKVLDYCVRNNFAKSQRKFAEAIGYDAGPISKAKNGDERYLTDKLFVAIERTFHPVFSLDWLLYGRGPMILADKPDNFVPDTGGRRHKKPALVMQESTAEPSAPLPTATGSTTVDDIVRRVQSEAERLSNLCAVNERLRADNLSLRNDLHNAIIDIKSAVTDMHKLTARIEAMACGIDVPMAAERPSVPAAQPDTEQSAPAAQPNTEQTEADKAQSGTVQSAPAAQSGTEQPEAAAQPYSPVPRNNCEK